MTEHAAMKSNTYRVVAGLLLAAALILATPKVLAHGTHEPLHGGIVQMVGDTAIELVAKGSDAYVYVIEHDSEYSSKGATGKLTVLKDGATTTATLTPDGSNRFVARGATLGTGARVIVAITMADGTSKLSARFSIK
jgi:hypothetical protein